MQSSRDLKVWEKEHQLVLDVYGMTGRFPREELYGLTGRIRRSAVSIPSNIAEGCCRSQGDFARFVRIAPGSASQLEYQLLLARDLDLLQLSELDLLSARVIEVKRMLAALLSRLTADG